MAVMTWQKPGEAFVWDFWWDFSSLIDAVPEAPASSTQFVETIVDENVRLTFIGTFSNNNSEGFPTAGTINQIRVEEQGVLATTLTGLSMSVPTFAAFVETGDTQGFLNLAFAGNDTINGNALGDTLHGLNGDDTVNGNAGNDTLYGDAGVDTLNGGTGADALIGGLGSDIYVVDNVGDSITELAGGVQGADRVKSFINWTLGSNLEKLQLVGTANIDGNGNTLPNAITGNEANNRLSGLTGGDTINGAGGNDKLIGGVGLDTLTGGQGADIFVLNAPAISGNRDIITDFSAPDDVIWLENSVYTALGAPAALTSGAFYIGAAAHDASDRVIYNNTTGQLYYDSDGSGANVAVLIAVLTGAPTISVADFVVI